MLIPFPRRVRLIKTMRVLFALLLLPLFCHAQQTRTLSCRFLGFQTVEDENSLTCVAPKVELACPFQNAEISLPVMVVAVDNVISFIDTKTRKPACSITVLSEPATGDSRVDARAQKRGHAVARVSHRGHLENISERRFAGRQHACGQRPFHHR